VAASQSAYVALAVNAKQMLFFVFLCANNYVRGAANIFQSLAFLAMWAASAPVHQDEM
jgi:hypothetical protein